MSTPTARTVLYASYYTPFIQYRGLSQRSWTAHDCDGFRLSARL